MDTFMTWLKDQLPARISIPLTLLIIILIGTLRFPLETYTPDALQNQLSKTPTIRWVATLVLSTLLLSLYYLNIYRAFRNKLTPKFGVLWDKNKEAYCPACQIPLSDYREFKNSSNKISYVFHCMKCDKMIPITNNGAALKLEEARNML